jgi:hypothetical protein
MKNNYKLINYRVYAYYYNKIKSMYTSLCAILERNTYKFKIYKYMLIIITK